MKQGISNGLSAGLRTGAPVLRVGKGNIQSLLRNGTTIGWYDSAILSTVTQDVNNHVSNWKDQLGSGRNFSTILGTPHWTVTGIQTDGSNSLRTGSISLIQPIFFYAVLKFHVLNMILFLVIAFLLH
jgi:hypothetical protein